jgi:hypothetical protein
MVLWSGRQVEGTIFAHVWEIFGTGSAFQIVDVTAASIPFVIAPGAPFPSGSPRTGRWGSVRSPHPINSTWPRTRTPTPSSRAQEQQKTIADLTASVAELMARVRALEPRP